jgi:hypothetical protein
MADYTALRSEILLAKDKLGVLNVQLSALSTRALAPGSTADLSGVLVARIKTLTAQLVVLSREVSDISASLTS